ncbi:TonB-dependent receptor [Bacteroidia bacterium]|nr:TonB-dependent receptor [Bacteroidia bacterium]
MKKICFIFLIFNVLSASTAAQNVTVSGYITDAENGETLISAAVFEQNSKKGTVSNVYGFYSITLPADDVALNFSYVGYAGQEVKFRLRNDTAINIKLFHSIDLQEVTVTGKRSEIGVRGSQMSAIEVPVAQIQTVPAIFGETDVIKALQLLPGVQSGTEGTAGFYVRGGGPDQNLMLLDEIPIYNVNHAMGFFSVFNADALKNVTLYKGSFPARFGERLSSVLDIRMKDGDAKSYHGDISIGLISTKLSFEGPIIKDKTTFSISGRRTYFDILAQPVIAIVAKDEGMEGTTAGYYFYDLNAKVSHKFSDKDRLYLSFYLGDDAIYAKMQENYGNEFNYNDGSDYNNTSTMKMNWKWGNMITALRWNHLINSKLFMNTTAAFTRYRFFLDMNQMESYYNQYNQQEYWATTAKYHSGINDAIVKSDFDFMPNPNHDIKFGLNYVFHQFKPDVIAAKEESSEYDPNYEPIDVQIHNDPIYANEMALYAEDNFSVFDFLKINAGLRYSAFLVQKQFYHSLQPRLSARALITDKFSVKAGYSYMSQYIHLLSNSSITLPTDLWVPVTKKVMPMKSQQVALGAFYNLKDKVELSAEIYYKTMNNVLEYKDGASFLGVSTGWEEKVNAGRGWSYGLELMAQKTVGKTTGWVAYTWSKSERLFDRAGQEINFGRAFPAKFDRRHDISITLSHKFSARFDIGATWIYSTGNATTLALQRYEKATLPYNNVGNRGGTLDYFESRNNYRMPDYHRLDIGFNFHRKKKHGTRTWSIGFYNLYNHQNPFWIYEDREGEGYYAGNPASSIPGDSYYVPPKRVLKQISIFPVIPSISYSYKW